MTRRRRLLNDILGDNMSNRHQFDYFGINRYLCTVLDDMRALDKSKNYSALKGLIEEAQVLGNRMEAGLRDVKDLNEIRVASGKARQAYKELRAEYEALEEEITKLQKIKSDSETVK